MSCSEWNTIKLKDICDYRTGKLNSNAAQENGKYPFFTCAPEPYKINSYSFDQDAIILAGNNANGKFHINRFNGKFDAYQRTYVMQSKEPNKVDNTYLYYYLSLQLNYLKEISVGSATRFLTKSILDEIEIKYPNYDEMKSIGNILSSLDDKIELNNEMNMTLEEMAQSIFKRWFVDFEFPNEDGKPYKSSGGEMVESELGMIPKGWEIGTLDNIGTFKNGKTIKQNLRDDNGKNLIYGSNGIIGKTDEILQNNNCIIIGRVGAYCGSIQLSLEPCWVTDNAIMGISKEEKYLTYLHRFLLNYPLRESAGGSAQPLINQSILKSIECVIPTQYLFEKYNDISRAILLKIDENIKENNLLSEIRDSILPKLMSGEISI